MVRALPLPSWTTTCQTGPLVEGVSIGPVPGQKPTRKKALRERGPARAAGLGPNKRGERNKVFLFYFPFPISKPHSNLNQMQLQIKF